jgi:phage terminase large subunit-like protein
VFGVARRMCKLSPDLVKEFGVNVRVGSLLVEDTFSKFLPIIRDPGDGSSPSCYIVDEFHEHGDPRQYNSMTTGMDAREQPLTLIITTAGHNQAGPCFQRRGFHLEALQGSVNVPDLFTLVYTLDKEDDWTDFETNRKANPNLGVSVIESQLRLQHQHAIQNHERQGSYKTKKCNLWTGAATTFLNLASWNAAPARPDWDDMQGRRCFLGADLASKIDLAALVALFPPDDEFDFWCAYFHYWSSEDYLAQVQNAHLSVWKNEGLVYECPGARIDLEEIVDEVRDIRTHVEVAEFCYDPYHATQLATSTSGEGIVAVEVQMHVKYLSPAMRELEALNNEGKLAHGGDACTTWQAGNLQASEDRKDNVFPRKGSSERKIDGMVALLLALFRAAQPPEEPEQSIYNTRGMRSI